MYAGVLAPAVQAASLACKHEFSVARDANWERHARLLSLLAACKALASRPGFWGRWGRIHWGQASKGRARHQDGRPAGERGPSRGLCGFMLSENLNLSRPKRGLRRARESSELRREGFWCGQWQQSAPRLSRAADRPRGDSWRQASGDYGCAATTCHRNFTGSRQTARHVNSEHRPRSSSTKKVSGAARASPSTPNAQTTCASQ